MTLGTVNPSPAGLARVSNHILGECTQIKLSCVHISTLGSALPWMEQPQGTAPPHPQLCRPGHQLLPGPWAAPWAAILSPFPSAQAPHLVVARSRGGLMPGCPRPAGL